MLCFYAQRNGDPKQNSLGLEQQGSEHRSQLLHSPSGPLATPQQNRNVSHSLRKHMIIKHAHCREYMPYSSYRSLSLGNKRKQWCISDGEGVGLTIKEPGGIFQCEGIILHPDFWRGFIITEAMVQCWLQLWVDGLLPITLELLHTFSKQTDEE